VLVCPQLWGALYHKTGQKSKIKAQNCGIACGDVILAEKQVFVGRNEDLVRRTGNLRVHWFLS
jgi:hypothetical protein